MTLDLLTHKERHAYTPEKHYLGVLCAKRHDAGSGKSWRHKGHGNCVECCREGARRWKLANPERARASTAKRDADRTYTGRREQWPIAQHIGNIRGRAKAAGLPCDLTTDFGKLLWRQQEGRCFWTGRELNFLIGEDRHPLRPSIDRLIPELGYVQGNVVWASNFANRARGDLSAEAFAELMVSFGFKQVKLP